MEGLKVFFGDRDMKVSHSAGVMLECMELGSKLVGKEDDHMKV